MASGLSFNSYLTSWKNNDLNFVLGTRVPRKIVLALSIGVTYGFLLAFMFLNQDVIEQTKEINSKPAKPSESTTTIEPSKNCKPLQKLAFAKTHKTGGK